MKNKYASKLTAQMLADIRTTEENMVKLAEDQVRLEFQLGELWKFVYGKIDKLAEEPELQMVKCSECKNYCNKYQLHSVVDSYHYDVICKSCLKEREQSDD